MNPMTTPLTTPTAIASSNPATATEPRGPSCPQQWRRHAVVYGGHDIVHPSLARRGLRSRD